MKKLYLLRHAKTSHNSSTGNDFDRALEEKGKNQVKSLIHFFNHNLVSSPIDCLVSSAKRTRQTFEGIRPALERNTPISTINFDDELYLASAESMLEKIWNYSSSNNLFVVGHNNGISDMACYLTEKEVLFGTAEFILLSFECDSWNEISKGTATIENRFCPSSSLE